MATEEKRRKYIFDKGNKNISEDLWTDTFIVI